MDKQEHTEPHPAAWGLTLEDWRLTCADLRIPAYRAKQMWHGLQERLIGSWDELTSLPIDLRRALAEKFDVAALTVSEVRETPDGVRKLLIACRDGELIESVLIPAEDRWTLCISSQAGCAYACAFCASGKAGFVRDLTAAEIVGQVILASPPPSAGHWGTPARPAAPARSTVPTNSRLLMIRRPASPPNPNFHFGLPGAVQYTSQEPR